MEKSNLTTIYWMEDYKSKLKDYIYKEEITIKYLNKLIEYFTKNNITVYKKFDKRDLDKIKNYFSDMIYYNHCQDNFNIFYKQKIRSKELYIYINNEEQYSCNIDINHTNYDGSVEWYDVIEQANARLDYIKTKYIQNKNLLNNFDKYIDQYNNKVKEFKKFIDSTCLNNIIDIYIYCSDKV